MAAAARRRALWAMRCRYLVRPFPAPATSSRVGEARARESLHQAIRQACAAAKIDPRQLHRACVGVAGVRVEDVANAVRKIIAEVIPAEIEVVGDMQIALQAALGTEPGVIVIAGTGSIAYGRDAQGKTARAGGWGFAISDEGSAHWIGRTAVAALLRAADESGDDRVAPSVVTTFPRGEVHLEGGIVRASWRAPPIRIQTSRHCFPRLWPPPMLEMNWREKSSRKRAGNWQSSPLSWSGRFFRGRIWTAPYRSPWWAGFFAIRLSCVRVFCDTLRQLDPRLEVNQQVVEPVAGALQIARKLASQPEAEVE